MAYPLLILLDKMKGKDYGGPISHNQAKTFDGPLTLERSGSEHRVGRFPPSLLRFLSPGNGGTEGGVKTIEEGRGERWSLP